MPRKRSQSVADKPVRDNIFSDGNNLRTTDVDSIRQCLPKQRVPISALRDPAMKQASQVFQELIQTETQYVNDLRVLVDVFRKPLSESEILSQKEVNSLFSNIHMILPTSEEFLARLTEIQATSLGVIASELKKLDSPVSSQRNSLPASCGANVKGTVALQQQATQTMLTGVSDLLCQFTGNQFKQYLVYCSGMGELHHKLTSLARKNENFEHFLREQLQNPLCRMMDLHSFLVMPMQRVTRYPMLLKELQKCAPSSSLPYKKLGEAIKQCEDILATINLRARMVQDLEKLVKINSQLYIPTKSDKQQYFASKATNQRGIPFDKLEIVTQGRKLIAEGSFTVKSPTNLADYAFLFNDILILSKSFTERPPFTTIIRRVIDRRNLILEEKESQVTDAGDIILHLTEVGYQIIVVSFQSKLRRSKWVKQLKSPVLAQTTMLPDLTKTTRKVQSFYAKEKSPREESKKEKKEEKAEKEEKKDEKKEKEEKREKLSKLDRGISMSVQKLSRKNKGDSKKKNKEKTTNSSIFSFLRHKTAPEVFPTIEVESLTLPARGMDSPKTAVSARETQQHRIMSLEQELHKVKSRNETLETQVTELACQLQESLLKIKKLEAQLANNSNSVN